MPSPSQFPRTTKLRHIIVGLILCSGYYHVNQLSIHNSYLEKDKEFPVEVQTYNQEMHFVMEHPKPLTDKTLQINVYLDQDNSKSFPVLCHIEGCMDFIADLPMRYKPSEITTFKTPFGDEFLRSVRYTDRETEKETIFNESNEYLNNYYTNIRLKLGSFLALHFLLLGLVGFTLYPNKAFAKEIKYTQTIQELVVLCAFTYLLYHQSKIVFLNIPLSHIEFYPLIVLILLTILLLVLYASENIIVLYDRTTGDVKVVPSSSRYAAIKTTLENAKQNLNIVLLNSEGKFRRRKFDELPDATKNLIDEGNMEIEKKKTHRTIDAINSTIEFQGESLKPEPVKISDTPVNPDADIFSIFISKVKTKFSSLRKGQYRTHFEKKALDAANKETNSNNQQTYEKRFFTLDEIAESDSFDHRDLNPEITELMSQKPSSNK